MNYASQVISRCTRDGVVQWQHVSAQLGISVETAKALHSPPKPAVLEEGAEPERPAVRRR